MPCWSSPVPSEWVGWPVPSSDGPAQTPDRAVGLAQPVPSWSHLRHTAPVWFSASPKIEPRWNQSSPETDRRLSASMSKMGPVLLTLLDAGRCHHGPIAYRPACCLPPRGPAGAIIRPSSRRKSSNRGTESPPRLGISLFHRTAHEEDSPPRRCGKSEG